MVIVGRLTSLIHIDGFSCKYSFCCCYYYHHHFNFTVNDYASLLNCTPVGRGFRHRAGCRASKDGQKFEHLDLGSRGIVLSPSSPQLKLRRGSACSFRIRKRQIFTWHGSYNCYPNISITTKPISWVVQTLGI